MGKIEFEGKIYEFEWRQLLLMLIFAPAFALGLWYSHKWIWLHEISAKLTIWLLNAITTGGESFVQYHGEPYLADTPWIIHIITESGAALDLIRFESLCTGVHAIAIFAGVILFIPHSLDKTTSKDIWRRKSIAIVVTTIVFYVVNILRMILQLYLYRNGADWEDVHYPISSASSFIAVACVLIMHKFVPEFIMALLWIGDELKAKFKKPADDVQGESKEQEVPPSEGSVHDGNEIVPVDHADEPPPE